MDVTPVVGVLIISCFVVRYLMPGLVLQTSLNKENRELVAFVVLSSWCLVNVV